MLLNCLESVLDAGLFPVEGLQLRVQGAFGVFSGQLYVEELDPFFRERFEAFFEICADRFHMVGNVLCLFEIGPIAQFDKFGVETDVPEYGSKDFRRLIFPQIALVLIANLLAVGAVVIHDAFLDIGRQETPAPMAGHESTERIKVFLIATLVFPVHDVLHPIEQFLGNDRFMVAGVVLPMHIHDAVVERILEDHVDPVLLILVSATGAEAFLIEDIDDLFETVAPCGVQFKGTADILRSFLVDDERLIEFVVPISDLGIVRITALFQFRLYSALYVFAQVPDVLIRHPAFDIEDQRIVIRQIATLARLDVFDNSLLGKPLDGSAVHRVPGEAIELPAQDAIRFAPFQHKYHFREQWAIVRFLGGFRFGKDFDDIQT
ncbi:MAG: hypothetical protein WCJ25_05445 [Candidatus Moraniibacteriota bacterium]